MLVEVASREFVMRAICVGNSHLRALSLAALAEKNAGASRPVSELSFIVLAEEAFKPTAVEAKDGFRLNSRLSEAIHSAAFDRAPAQFVRRVTFGEVAHTKGDVALFSLIGGNAHNIMGLLAHQTPFDFSLAEAPGLPIDRNATLLPEAALYERLDAVVSREISGFLKALRHDIYLPLYHIESPPPIADIEHIRKYLDPVFGDGAKADIAPAVLRYKLWRLHSKVVRDRCVEAGVCFVPHPRSATDGEGFLRPEYWAENATHANAAYGALVLDQIEAIMNDPPWAGRQKKASNPYQLQAAASFWAQGVAAVEPSQLAPVRRLPFRISKTDRVATAGSCFAQHISRHLRQNGFSYLVTETAHPLLTEKGARESNFGTFTARFGNIYTSRQLTQLIRRARGTFVPVDDHWQGRNGGFVDPYRPTIQPGGFASVEDLRADRERHFAAVSRMLEMLDVFVFTLGLTECWSNRQDGAVYPLCPGVAGGTFDPEQHVFQNLSVEDVVADFSDFLRQLDEVNANARVILTVSPVPLKATASEKHVLSATTYSKSVLRVAAEMLSETSDRIAYFPSYEIITGSYSRGKYFENDLRNITDEGVRHVMSVFLKHLTNADLESTAPPPVAAPAKPAETKSVAELACDEELLGLAADFADQKAS